MAKKIKSPLNIKPLPADEEAEKAILGSLILAPYKISDIIGKLDISDFYYRSHKILFSRILTLYNEEGGKDNFVIDTLALKNKITPEGEDPSINSGFINDIMTHGSSLTNLDVYINIVKEKSLLRKLIKLSNDVIERCYNPLTKPLEIIRELEDKIFELSQERERGDFVKLGEEAKIVLREIEEKSKSENQVTGVPTGFEKLDILTTGFHPGELIILAARPSMGKTSLALDIARNAAQSNFTVAFFSLEMGIKQIVLRILSAVSKVEYRKLRTGYFSIENEYREIENATVELKNLNMFIDDTSGITILELKSKLKRMMIKEGKKVDLVIVDYLQLMQGDKDFKVREQEISYISRGLKSIAKEFNVPVIALSQLNRSPEIRRGDHRPQLSDLRESGSIEQDADLVLFIYRPEKYGEEDKKGIADLIIGKNRNGELGIVKLAFIEKFATFKERVQEDDNS